MIEGDSKNIISILKQEKEPSQTINILMEEGKAIISTLEVITMQHTYMEVNKVEDGFTNLNVEAHQDQVLEGILLLNIQIILIDEYK